MALPHNLARVELSRAIRYASRDAFPTPVFAQFLVPLRDPYATPRKGKPKDGDGTSLENWRGSRP